MRLQDGLFTAEAVAAGHPDKVCDRISDAILDAFLARDRLARVACESFAADGKVIVAGEFKTARTEDFEAVRGEAEAIVRRTLREVGYGSADLDIDPDGCEVEIRFNGQSAEIDHGVGHGEVLGAGDQGMMFGFAIRETDALMPLAWSLATDLIARGTEIRLAGGSPLRGDGKSQVTVRYQDGRPAGVQAVVVSWQHAAAVGLEEIRRFLEAEVVDAVVPAVMRTADFRLFLNPAGSFTVGGPKGDTGLTGRKIIVDTYGGAAPHGGGAFSGKDPTKVDRSGAYAARNVAKTIVAAGLADAATVQLAYAIGVAEPVSIAVDTHGTGAVPDARIADTLARTFDLTPAGIIRSLDLRRPIYTPTSSLGHFGRHRDPAVCLWEATPLAGALREALRETALEGVSF